MPQLKFIKHPDLGSAFCYTGQGFFQDLLCVLVDKGDISLTFQDFS